jgi:hypothetical protein
MSNLHVNFNRPVCHSLWPHILPWLHHNASTIRQNVSFVLCHNQQEHSLSKFPIEQGERALKVGRQEDNRVPK